MLGCPLQVVTQATDHTITRGPNKLQAEANLVAESVSLTGYSN